MTIPPAKAGTSDTTLVIRRSFDADIDTVFRALTDPDAIKDWFGPGAAKVNRAESDLRVGAKWVIEMIGENCEEHNISGEYLTVDRPRKVVFTWAWQSTPERVSQVTYVLQSGSSRRTALTLTHERFADVEARNRHEFGWNGSLDKLGPWLAR